MSNQQAVIAALKKKLESPGAKPKFCGFWRPQLGEPPCEPRLRRVILDYDEEGDHSATKLIILRGGAEQQVTLTPAQTRQLPGGPIKKQVQDMLYGEQKPTEWQD